MSLKRIQTIVKQMCTICSEAVNANFIVADDNLEKIASSYITHTKDELKPISPNSIIARVIKSQQPAAVERKSRDYSCSNCKDRDICSVKHLVCVPIFSFGAAIGAIAVESPSKPLIERFGSIQNVVKYLDDTASLLADIVNLDAQRSRSDLTPPSLEPEEGCAEAGYAVTDKDGQIIAYNAALTQFFPRNWKEKIYYIHDLINSPADIKPNQESFFFYSGFEHADFWGTVTVLSCAGQPSAPEAKVYYFRSLRKRGSAYENYDLVSKDSFFLAACSSQFQTVITRADYFAKSRIPVLLCGNDGDGRNLIARYIHTASIRKYDHFVTVDCSEIPLLEQVDFVFGPLQSGMLTGVLWKANKGCIYFKNIEYMSLALQERIAGLLMGRISPRSYNIFGRLDIHFLFSTSNNFSGLQSLGYFDKNLFNILADSVIQMPLIDPGSPYLNTVMDDMAELFSAKFNCVGFTIGDELKAMIKRNSYSLLDLQRYIEIIMKEASKKKIDISDIPQFESLLANESHESNEDRQMELIKVLMKRNMKRSDIAKHLGISRATLYRRIAKLNSGADPNS